MTRERLQRLAKTVRNVGAAVFLLTALLLGQLLFAPIRMGGEDAGDEVAPKPSRPSAEEEAPSESAPAERTERVPAVRRAVAQTLAGFLEAFLNGKGRLVRTYLSETCRPEDVDEFASYVDLVGWSRDASRGEYRVEVDESLLTITQTDFWRIRVVFPWGDALHISLNGEPVPARAIWGNIGTGSFEFRMERGVWTLTQCGEMASAARMAREDWFDWLKPK